MRTGRVTVRTGGVKVYTSGVTVRTVGVKVCTSGVIVRTVGVKVRTVRRKVIKFELATVANE